MFRKYRSDTNGIPAEIWLPQDNKSGQVEISDSDHITAQSQCPQEFASNNVVPIFKIDTFDSMGEAAPMRASSPRPVRSKSTDSRLTFDRVADVEPQAVEWFWENRLARGKLTLLSGDPNIGKSQLTVDMVAAITTGRPWPDGGVALPFGTTKELMINARQCVGRLSLSSFPAYGAAIRLDALFVGFTQLVIE